MGVQNGPCFIEGETEAQRGMSAAQEPRRVPGVPPADCSDGETEALGCCGPRAYGLSLEPPTLAPSRKDCFSFFRREEEKEAETKRLSLSRPPSLDPGWVGSGPLAPSPRPSPRSRRGRCLLHQPQLEREGAEATASSLTSPPPASPTPRGPRWFPPSQLQPPGLPVAPAPHPVPCLPKPLPSGSPPALHSPACPHPRPEAARRTPGHPPVLSDAVTPLPPTPHPTHREAPWGGRASGQDPVGSYLARLCVCVSFSFSVKALSKCTSPTTQPTRLTIQRRLV